MPGIGEKALDHFRNFLGFTLNAGIGFLGQVSSVIPGTKSRYVRADFDKGFDPAAERKFVLENQDSLDPLFDVEDVKRNGVACKGAFDDYRRQRAVNVDKLSFPEGARAAALLTDSSPEAKAIKEKLNAALRVVDNPESPMAPSPIVSAQKTFNDDMADLQEIVKRSNGEIPIRGEIARIKGDAVKAIKAQHTKEQVDLKEIFEEDRGFITQLKGAPLNLDDPGIKALQEEMKAALKASQGKQLADFEATINKTTTEMHVAASTALRKLAFLASEYERDATTRAMIDEHARKNPQNRGKHAHGVIQQNANGKTTGIFRGFPISKIENQDIAGIPFKQDKDGKLKAQLPSSIWLDDFSSRNKTKLLFMRMAQRQKAEGFQGAEITIENPGNPKAAMRAAKDAVAAYIETGFPENELVFKVSTPPDGKVQEYKGTEGIAKLMGAEKAILDQKAASYAAERQKTEKIVIEKIEAAAPAEIKKMREQVKADRAAAAARTAAITPPPTPPIAGASASHTA